MILFGLLLISAAASVGVVAWWGAYNVYRRPRRLGGVAIFVAGCFGALGALALHWTMFLTFGGDAKHLLSEVALLWAAAGFAWVGSIAALVFEAWRFVSSRGARAHRVHEPENNALKTDRARGLRHRSADSAGDNWGE
jgi:hypothetical protein